MKLLSYKWRDGSRINIDPNKAGKELNRIKRKHKRITREIVAEEARPKRHIYHNHIYGVSDMDAVREFRLIRAGEIMRAVVAVIEYVPGEEPVEVPGFPHIRSTEDPGENSFHPINDVMEDVDMRETLIEDFLIRMRNLRRIFGNIKELAKVWEAVDRIGA